MIRCLRIVAFRRLLMAYVLNELAWSVGTLALSLLVYKRTGSAIGSAAFFLCSQFLPALLNNWGVSADWLIILFGVGVLRYAPLPPSW